MSAFPGIVALEYNVHIVLNYLCTIDQEIFMLKIIHVKSFCGVKILWLCLIHEIFLTVGGCNRDKRLECS